MHLAQKQGAFFFTLLVRKGIDIHLHLWYTVITTGEGNPTNQKGKVRIMKAMEKINAVVKAAQASKDDALHKIGLALESIANDIERSAKDLKAANQSEVANYLTIWHYKGRIDASLHAFQSIVICSGLSDTPEGREVIKIRSAEVEYYE